MSEVNGMFVSDSSAEMFRYTDIQKSEVLKKRTVLYGYCLA